MLSYRAVVILALSAGALFNVDLRAAESSGEEPRLTRVFHLQGMETREAVALLRSRVQVRQIAEIRGLDIVIVTEVAEKVDRSESLLRERDAVARAIDPHDPVNPEPSSESPIGTRVFRIEGLDPRGVVTVLRSIYQMREVTELVDGDGVSVRAPLYKLDASEALLRELGLLAEPAGT